MNRRTIVLTTVVVLLGIAGAAAGVMVDKIRGPQWSAETGILIRLASPDTVLLTGLPTTVEAEDLIDAAAVAKSQAVLTSAAGKLGGGATWSDLAKRVTVEPVGTSHIIKITAKTTTSAAATRMADAVADSYLEATAEQLRATTTTLSTVPRPPDPGRQGGSDVTADVRSRAVVLATGVTAAQVLRTDEPVQLTPSIKTPITLGIVGLAAGALFAVAVTVLRPGANSRRRRGTTFTIPQVEVGELPPVNGRVASRTDDATDPVAR